MKYYRIADWGRHYENNRTRDMVHMSWVPMPNRWDGDGYTELMDHPNAASHFGAWCLLVQVASRCEPRGSLLRQSRTLLREPRTQVRRGSYPQSYPHDAESLSRMTRLPAEVFEEAIPRLVSIGWLEELEIIPQEGAATPQEGAVIPHPSAEGTERNGTERKEGKERRERTERKESVSCETFPKPDRPRLQSTGPERIGNIFPRLLPGKLTEPPGETG